MRDRCLPGSRPPSIARTAGWIPTAFLSYGFYCGTRWMLRRLQAGYFRRHPDAAEQWQVLSKELLARPGALPLLQTTGPRWNPHAVIATAGPLRVRGTLEVAAETARSSAESWFLTVYSFPGRRTLGGLTSLDATTADWIAYRPEQAGRILVAARYYGLRNSARFPEIRADGGPGVAARGVSARVNEFYSDLAGRQSPFYCCLSHHVYPMLRSRHWLPAAWIGRVYLPVGNPETRFQYGPVEAGERLGWQMAADRFNDFEIYVTLYTRCSFPSLWYRIVPSSDPVGPPATQRGFFLVRVQPKRRGVALSAAEWERLIHLEAAEDPGSSPH